MCFSRYEALKAALQDMPILVGAGIQNGIIILDKSRAVTLKVPCYDGDFARIAIGENLSAQALQDLVDPSKDIRGVIRGPFRTLMGGRCEKLAHVCMHIIRKAVLLPSVVVFPIEQAQAFAEKHDLCTITAGDFEKGLNEDQAKPYLVSRAQLPLDNIHNSYFNVVRYPNSGLEHFTIECGTIDRNKPVLVRVHSSCITGDIMGSLKCDCGPQLKKALNLIGENKSGLVLYLNQEGRGIGIANKIRYDTVEANVRCGFKDEQRDFKVAADILNMWHIDRVNLMTNNPNKINQLTQYGIQVNERVPLVCGLNANNQAYLQAKQKYFGHFIDHSKCGRRK